MKIVFFGTPDSAVVSLEQLLKSGYEIVLAVTQPEKPSGRGQKPAASAVKKYAIAHGLTVIEPAKIRTDIKAYEIIRAARPTINIVVAFGQLIPSNILYLPPLKTLNVHFSLLPKYRGAAPVQWAILNDEVETGITIIELNEKMDEGDILIQERTAIQPRETAAELENRLSILGAELLIKTLKNIHNLQPVPQDHARASYAPKIKKEDGRLAWSDTAARIDRLVRALADRPGVFTFFQGKRLLLHRGIQLAQEANHHLAPGTILGCDKKGIAVACGEKSVYLIQELQPEGKNRMKAYDFSLGARINPGKKFED